MITAPTSRVTPTAEGSQAVTPLGVCPTPVDLAMLAEPHDSWDAALRTSTLLEHALEEADKEEELARYYTATVARFGFNVGGLDVLGTLLPGQVLPLWEASERGLYKRIATAKIVQYSGLVYNERLYMAGHGNTQPLRLSEFGDNPDRVTEKYNRAKTYGLTGRWALDMVAPTPSAVPVLKGPGNRAYHTPLRPPAFLRRFLRAEMAIPEEDGTAPRLVMVGIYDASAQNESLAYHELWDVVTRTHIRTELLDMNVSLQPAEETFNLDVPVTLGEDLLAGALHLVNAVAGRPHRVGLAWLPQYGIAGDTICTEGDPTLCFAHATSVDEANKAAFLMPNPEGAYNSLLRIKTGVYDSDL